MKQFCFCLRTHMSSQCNIYFPFFSIRAKGRKREEGLSSLDNKRIEFFSEREEDPFFIDVDVGLAV